MIYKKRIIGRQIKESQTREHNLEQNGTERNGTEHDAKNMIKMPFYDFNGVSRTYLDKKNDQPHLKLPLRALGLI